MERFMIIYWAGMIITFGLLVTYFVTDNAQYLSLGKIFLLGTIVVHMSINIIFAIIEHFYQKK